MEWYARLPAEQVASAELRVPAEMAIWLDLWERGTAWKVMAEEAMQADAAFAKYFGPAGEAGDHEVIVCHGNIIRYFILRVLQAPPELWLHADIYNCGICEVTVGGERGMQLISFNDSGHLPHNMRVFF